MKRIFNKKTWFYIPIIVGIMMILYMDPLFGLVTSKEKTGMPQFPSYFESGLRVANDQKNVHNQNETDHGIAVEKVTNCLHGGCEDRNDATMLSKVSVKDEHNNDPQGNQAQSAIKDSLSVVHAEQDLEQLLPLDEEVKQLPGEIDNAVGSETLPLSEDPVTRELELELIETGLLSRHAEITESIFLMEQQLKQAQLIVDLMEMLGPDTPIEIAPGKFKTFSDTPAGQKIAAERAVATLQSQAEIYGLEMKVFEASKLIEMSMNPISDMVELQTDETMEKSIPIPDLELKLREIIGHEDNLEAIFSLGDDIIGLKIGDKLPTGEEITQITKEYVELNQVGQTIKFKID